MFFPGGVCISAGNQGVWNWGSRRRVLLEGFGVVFSRNCLRRFVELFRRK
jgi:hypothetical protein